MDPAWANDILKQCRDNGAAYHFKQKGRILAAELGCKDREGKKLEEWPREFQIQEFPRPVAV
jgi:protein gp37